MEKLMMKAYAKINWTLDVVGKRSNGYHDVDMIMQSIDLHDRIIIYRANHKNIVLQSNSPFIPRDSRNIAYKAAELLKQHCMIDRGAHIYIDKKIPIAAGLAGGSTNAAAILLGLNRFWNLGLQLNELQDLGLKLGADVPFCLLGGTVKARGIGEIITPLPCLSPIWLVLVKPSFSVSTKKVYQSLKWDKVNIKPDTEKMIQALNDMDLVAIGGNMVNVLECVTTEMHPEITNIKQDLLNSQAIGAVMSGSGPTVYGIYQNWDAAQGAKRILEQKHKQVILTKTRDSGIEIIEEVSDGKN